MKRRKFLKQLGIGAGATALAVTDSFAEKPFRAKKQAELDIQKETKDIIDQNYSYGDIVYDSTTKHHYRFVGGKVES